MSATNEKLDPKKIGVPNICFSLTKDNDHIENKFSKQRMSNGFDDSETWSLRDTIARFIIPRLKRFKKINNGFPISETSRSWNTKINKMIKAFELVCRDDGTFMLTEKEQKQYEEGFKLFYENYLDLWW